MSPSGVYAPLPLRPVEGPEEEKYHIACKVLTKFRTRTLRKKKYIHVARIIGLNKHWPNQNMIMAVIFLVVTTNVNSPRVL